MHPRVLIAGIGNIFLGDDAFGVEVAQKLLRRPQTAGVRVEDFGIRGLDLIYALSDGPEFAILIDAVPRGEAIGTLYVLEPNLTELGGGSGTDGLIEAHSMHPLKVLQSVAAMGGGPRRVLIVGCEPKPFCEEDQDMELSAPVRAAVDEAVTMIESLVARILHGELSATAPPSSASINQTQEVHT